MSDYEWYWKRMYTELMRVPIGARITYASITETVPNDLDKRVALIDRVINTGVGIVRVSTEYVIQI